MNIAASETPKSFLRFWNSLDAESQQAATRLALEGLYRWGLRARDKQLIPKGNWTVWLILAGRGWGKTETGAQAVRRWIERDGVKRVHFIGRTASDVRDVMVEGPTGILAVSPPWNRPTYEPSKRRLTWPNGAVATTFTGDKPDQLRGPQCEKAWCDELAAWRYAAAWDNLMLGLRIGKMPQCVVTTTPRPIPIIRELVKKDRKDVVVTRGSTYENIDNLAGAFRDEIIRRYEGTTLGAQELYAEILAELPGAQWKRADLESHRVDHAPEFMHRIIVAIDPAITATEESDETGIMVQGLGRNKHGYLLDDLTLKASPNVWAQSSITAYNDWEADLIVAEANQGGDMVAQTIHSIDNTIPVKLVHASRGKRTRSEPIASLNEQGRIHHVGHFSELEDQLCTWVPGDKSPDRLDAYVWGFSELMLGGAGEMGDQPEQRSKFPSEAPVREMETKSRWKRY